MARTAIVLFNLGGPDSPEAVQPFLFNLFNDPAIIGLPGPFRWLLAKLISRRRAPVAREIYANLGGGSPLLPLTQEQALALQAELSDLGDVRVFISMRYWHPRAAETVGAVAAWRPDDVVLLPLYPQFSTTTTGSSLAEWQQVATAKGLTAPSRSICCYPVQRGFLEAQADEIVPHIEAARASGVPRVLFSAHGLPKRVIEGGDAYQWQVETTAAAVVNVLAGRLGIPLDWVVCYQSRVGPMEWIGPSTETELHRAGADGVPVVVVPIAFVSEHSETLVELDIEYKALADTCGIPAYHRVPAVATNVMFIQGLAALVRAARGRAPGTTTSDAGTRICPKKFRRCAMTGVI